MAGLRPFQSGSAIVCAVLPSRHQSTTVGRDRYTNRSRPSFMVDLAVTLGRLHLQNPILVASGTFGYAREMAGIVDFRRLGGITPKTVTRQPRAGNNPPRTVETPAGMLNAIGLDNDGIDHFITHHLPYLRTLP